MFEGKEQFQETAPPKNLKKQIVLFLASFIVVFVFSTLFYAVLSSAFSSESAGENDSILFVAQTQDIFAAQPPAAKPLRIIIESVGIDQNIENPESRDIAVLDAALLEGVVRYPGSGILGDDVNMFLFGHSTNWETVRNPVYQSFNNLDKVRVGEVIRLQSETHEYLYEVKGVTLENADKAWVSLGNDQKLFISTCNTFGKKTDRFVVEADFLGSIPLVASAK